MGGTATVKATRMDTPFVIGKEYWLPVLHPYEVTVPCNVCYGQRVVTLILGNGESVSVECEACGKGYEGPQGTIMEYQHKTGAERFVIESVSSMHGDRWYVISTTGKQASWSDLCETEADAIVASENCRQEFIEENMRRSRHRRDYAKNKAWSVQYHEKCIKEYEEKIAWHRAKVSERKQKPMCNNGAGPSVDWARK